METDAAPVILQIAAFGLSPCYDGEREGACAVFAGVTVREICELGARPPPFFTPPVGPGEAVPYGQASSCRPRSRAFARSRSRQFFALSTSAFLPIQGIMPRNSDPIFSIGCASACFRAAFSSGCPARLSRMKFFTNRPD